MGSPFDETWYTRQGDTSVLQATLRHGKGRHVVLNPDATVQLHVQPGDLLYTGKIKKQDAGLVEFDIKLLTSGAHDANIRVTNPDNTRMSFPNHGTFTIVVATQ